MNPNYDVRQIRKQRRRQRDWRLNAGAFFIPGSVLSAIEADDKEALDKALKLHGVDDETRRNIIERV